MISIVDGNIMETDCRVLVFPIGTGVALFSENGEEVPILAENDSYRLGSIYPIAQTETAKEFRPLLLIGACSLTENNELDLYAFHRCLAQLKRLLEDNHVYSVAMPAYSEQELIFRILEELFAGSLIHLKLYKPISTEIS
jgi:hypothetical protein